MKIFSQIYFLLSVLSRRSSGDSDSLMELTELVHKGEKKGIFMDKMPASIQRMIHSENLTFVKNRDVYNQEYFKFVKNLVARNSVCDFVLTLL